MEDKEIKNPIIINGFDFSLNFFSGIFLDKDAFSSLSLLRSFEKGLLTLKTNILN